MAKPRLFIGSSTENLKIAYAIQENLEHDCDCTVWTQSVFALSKSSLESLVDTLGKFDAAVFVFSPDDVTSVRGKEVQTVRDNVIFELGLFIGRLGRERTFLVIPRSLADFHLPTDLLGMTPATYDPKRPDKNWAAALGAACNQMRNALAQPVATAAADVNSERHVLTDAEITGVLQAWLGHRDARLNTQPIYFTDVDKELSLPAGSAKKLLKAAAQKWHYEPEQEGPTLVVFREVPTKIEHRSRWPRGGLEGF